METMKFEFGKYKGEILSDVARKDSKYVYSIAGAGASFKMRDWMTKNYPEVYDVLSLHCNEEAIEFERDSSKETFIRDPRSRKW